MIVIIMMAMGMGMVVVVVTMEAQCSQRRYHQILLSHTFSLGTSIMHTNTRIQ